MTLGALLNGQRKTNRLDGSPPDAAAIDLPVDALKIARIGEHPVGFDTCAYDKAELKALTGATVDELELDHMFDLARDMKPIEVEPFRLKASELNQIGDMDEGELDRSLRLAGALTKLQSDGEL